MKRYSKKQKWLFGILIFVLLFATATTIANEIAANRGQELPGYEKKDIEGTVEKLSQGQTLTKKESTFLYEQTGLGEDAFMALADRGEASELLKYQDALFQKSTYSTISTNFFTGEEALNDEAKDLLLFADLQDGDVLVTAAAHTLGWQHGHCGLIVDAEEGKILEAFTIGQPSEICSLDKWLRYPNVIQLRPKSKDRNSDIGTLAANYGKANLNHIPYSLFSDLQDDESDITKTHCAHLIRMSYLPYGIELKEGLIVTPKDIANSDDFYVVQVRGMDPTKLWE